MERYLGMLLSLLLVGWLIAPTVAGAGALCGERAKLAEVLEARHAELPVSMGLSSNGAIIEVFASPSGSWTIIVTRPGGMSCLVAAGDNWEDLAKHRADVKT